MQTTAQRPPLNHLDPERIRFDLERTLVEALAASPDLRAYQKTLVPADPSQVRRRLLGDALRLSESMAPSAYAYAAEAARVLGVEGTLELYQSSGRENAAIHLIEAPILLEIQGRLLSLLDPGAGAALFGHELGHYLAHGPWTPMGEAAFVGVTLAQHDLLDAPSRELLRGLSVAREITADRFGLLACGDLDAALRLEMIATTGLAGRALTWDTKAYLQQCREVMEATASAGQQALSTTHPEHSLRAWALWLFSETDTYRDLTGRGPGTRTLAAVDAQIGAVLEAPQVDDLLAVQDEPPQFLLECALACAVLVAEADGEVADTELEAIEDAFATKVPGWSELLDIDVALDRFYETAPLVRTGGADLARRLFLLLSHVMGADDVVDAREVQMVLAIGEALGFAAEFRRWIRPAVETMGGTVQVDVPVPVAIPLPARKDEIREALAAFCDTVRRQGTARISPRRLLRIAGAEVGDAAAVTRVEGVLLAAEIDAEPTLGSCPADAMLRLTSRRAPPATTTPAVPLDDARKSVIAGLTRLRDELVSGDGRSPSVRLRRVRKGRAFDLCRLDAFRTGSAERALALLSAGKAATLVTAEDAGRHDEAAACADELRQLERMNLDRFEETGASDLCVGYPFVIGNVVARGESGPGYGIRAPLVLQPVTLQRDGRGARGFSVQPRVDEEPVVNQSLLRLLFNKAGLALPDELLAELDALAADNRRDASALVAKLAEVGVSLRAETTSLGPLRERDEDLDGTTTFLALEECAVLGLFAQSSSDLLQDYDALLAQLHAGDKDLPTLLAAGAGLLPAQLQAATDATDGADPGPSAPHWPLLDADPSQRDVIAACAGNRVTVVDGPPGTGKSQVIVNLVADALRRGQRVAVVAEKRAALDVVYQRLESLGLRDAAAVVHDVRDDRKALFARIAERIKAPTRRTFNETRHGILRKEHDDAATRLERRRGQLAHVPSATGLTVGELMATRAAGTPIEVPPGLAGVDAAGLATIGELTERLHPYADLWRDGAWWRTQDPNRPGLHEIDDAGLATLRQQLQAAIAPAAAADAALAGEPAVSAADLDVLREAIAALHDAVQACAGEGDRRLLAALVVHPEVDVASVRAKWTDNATALATWTAPQALQGADALARDAAVLRSYATRWWRLLSPTWWRTRGSLRRGLVQAWPERAAESLSPAFLAEVLGRVAAQRTWEETARLFAALDVAELAPADADTARARWATLATLADALGRARPDREALARAGIPWPTSAAEVETTAQRLTQAQARLAVIDAARSAVAPLRPSFPWCHDASADTLRELQTRLAADAHRLRESDGWRAQLRAAHAVGADVLDACAAALPDADAAAWRDAVGRAWADAHLQTLQVAMPELTELGTVADEQRVTRAAETMRRVDLQLRELEADRIAAALDGAELLTIPDAQYRARRTPAQKLKEQIGKEVGKSRRLMPLRQFVRTFADDGLLDLIPCWMVSPETMAVLFPRQPLFDLVVFDEASQCTVEAGFPVMLRAKRVVVAGDDKQMPPTKFFELGETATEDEDLSQAQLAARDAFAAESLLVLARGRCPHAGLTWHYRCRAEELIAYSNHAMYDGDLRTIPATAGPKAPSALRWVEVADGEYDAGLNRPEAERVVDLLAELLAEDPRPTLGVVAFNLKQRQTILDAIERRVAADAGFADAWTAASTVDALDERPFVRNLESVQGDERDVIVFSLGHAPVMRQRKGGTSEPYVPARFGPLGQRGGERRLNVAISRAKRRCYVVSSFDPTLLHVGQSLHSGPRLFKGYLEFASHKSAGRHDLADRVLDQVRGTSRDPIAAKRKRRIDGHLPLPAQIALELERRGYRCTLDVGSSSFKVPLAVAPAEPADGPSRLAILTDEGDRGVSAFDQYVHQPLVLGLRGWTVMHVDAAGWGRRKDEILARIGELVGGQPTQA